MKLIYFLFIITMSIIDAADTKKLFVLINNKRTLAIDFTDHETILNLKQTICNCKDRKKFGLDFQNITPDKIILQKFIWNARGEMTTEQAVATVLENNKKCADYALKNSSIVVLTVSTLLKRSLSFNADLKKSD